MTAAIHAPRRALEHIIKTLQQSNHAAWSGESAAPRRLGLAVSGGVDSMALVYLCGKATRFLGRDPRDNLTGFIVDHRLRKRSTDEAHRVADWIDDLGVEPKVLTIDWARLNIDPGSLTNLESVARRSRYRALGTACRDAHIDQLFVAHHADDQAETVLLRILGGYTGTGLRGMKHVGPIPECEGIFGVHASGQSNHSQHEDGRESDRDYSMPIEEGGVSLVRPLLSFTKAELRAVCKEASVPWVEDHTNVDKTYTLRNTTRHLLASDALPQALQSSRLLRLAQNIDSAEQRLEIIAHGYFERTSISLNPYLGTVAFVQPHFTDPEQHDDVDRAYHIKALWLRKLIATVSPNHHISLQDIHPMTERVSGVTDLESGITLPRITSSGVSLWTEPTRGNRDIRHFIQRTPPNQDERTKQQLHLNLQTYRAALGQTAYPASRWHLWDGRYWIRILSRRQRISPTVGHVSIRFLDASDIARTKKQLPSGQARKRLGERLRAARGDLRFTIPAIFERKSGTEEAMLLALPSLLWTREGSGWGRWIGPPEATSASSSSEEAGDGQMTGVAEPDMWWEIRYKSVELDDAVGNHVIAGLDLKKRADKVESADESRGDGTAEMLVLHGTLGLDDERENRGPEGGNVEDWGEDAEYEDAGYDGDNGGAEW